MLKFIDFLKQNINETHVKEFMDDYYFVPINIDKTANNPTKRKNLVNEVLECARDLISKYKRVRISFRKTNKKFIENAFGILNKSELRELISKIITSLNINDFSKELQDGHSAYAFIVQIDDLCKRTNIELKDKSIKFKKIYIKFEFVNILYKDEKSNVYGMQKILKKSKDYVIIDPQKSFVDVISIHVSGD